MGRPALVSVGARAGCESGSGAECEVRRIAGGSGCRPGAIPALLLGRAGQRRVELGRDPEPGHCERPSVQLAGRGNPHRTRVHVRGRGAVEHLGHDGFGRSSTALLVRGAVKQIAGVAQVVVRAPRRAAPAGKYVTALFVTGLAALFVTRNLSHAPIEPCSLTLGHAPDAREYPAGGGLLPDEWRAAFKPGVPGAPGNRCGARSRSSATRISIRRGRECVPAAQVGLAREQPSAAEAGAR